MNIVIGCRIGWVTNRWRVEEWERTCSCSCGGLVCGEREERGGWWRDRKDLGWKRRLHDGSQLMLHLRSHRAWKRLSRECLGIGRYKDGWSQALVICFSGERLIVDEVFEKGREIRWIVGLVVGCIREKERVRVVIIDEECLHRGQLLAIILWIYECLGWTLHFHCLHYSLVVVLLTRLVSFVGRRGNHLWWMCGGNRRGLGRC
jgi:hypothetical protein